MFRLLSYFTIYKPWTYGDYLKKEYIYIYIYIKGVKKIKCTLVQALRFCTGRTAQRVGRGIALLFLDHGTRRGWGVSVWSGRTLPPEKTRYPLYRRQSGPEGRSGQVRKISPPPGFDPRTVQPVASRYTDYATKPTLFQRNIYIYISVCVCVCIYIYMYIPFSIYSLWAR